MTSTPSQSSTPAQSTPAAATAPSYASAAGSKKAPSTAGQAASHNAKSGSISSGRPAVTPALPVQGVNGAISGEASRKNSVTIGANGSTYPGSVNHSHKNSIKFGNFDSPVMSHSTPQASAAPQQLPSNSPAPPSPIPISAVSGGGRPPSVALGGMTFGSLGSDDRSRQSQHGPPPNAHGRRESAQSAAGSDMGSQNHNRNSYHGRGRSFNNGGSGSFNSHHNQMGFPPTNYRGNAGPGGRGGMSFQPGSHSHGGHSQNRGPMHVTNSPQPSRSPHLANSALSTPNMPPASLAQPMAAQTPPHQYYHQPMGGMQPQYGYPPNPSGQFSMSQNMSMGVPGYQYNMPPYGGPPNGPPYGQNFNAPAFTPGAPAAPMVRSGSQQADKPASAAPQSFAPIVGSGAPPAPGGKSAFVRPAKSAAIRITTPQGEAVDLSTVKAPVSPAPATASKAPAAASPTPARAGANAHLTKTPKEVQEELRLKIAQFASRGAAESPAKDEAKEVAEKEAAEKEAAEKEAAEKAAAEAKAEAEAKAKEEAEAKAKAEAEAKAKAEEEAKAKADAASAAAPTNEEDEMERMIREMEEAERLEAEREAAYERKKAEEKAKQAVIDAANKKKDDAETDRKLREQEREMERLEEEKERRRAQGGGPTKSVAELMAMSRNGKDLPEEEKPSADASDKAAKPSPDAKLPKIEAPAGPGRGDNKARKPAALNLVPHASKTVEPAQPSAALQSLKSARFLTVMNSELYPSGILSPNPALNSAVSKKGKTFQYDAAFLLQFKTVFTEQPSVEFQSQVKTLIGDENNRGGSARSSTPRTGSSKGGAANPIGAPIGGFGSGRMGSGPGGMAPRSGTNPVGQFSRGSSFPSSRNASGNIPGSPRVGSSRAGRNNSSRHPKVDKQAVQMPLTAGQEIKPIAVTETGWKPASLSQKPGSNVASGPMDPAMVQRKVKAALNKMTPENFERISEQIMVIAGQSKDETDGRTLRQVIQLTFEKATDEAHWASMYAKFCKRMLDSTSNDIKDDSIKDKNGAVVTGGTLFRKYLLNRCQEEFERGWKVNLPKIEESAGTEAKSGEAALLSDEYYAAAAAKRRGLGLVQFIGELYKLGMLTDRIMHGCIRGLVDFNGEPDESEIESLSKLLTTIGGALETSTTSPPGRNSALMDAYFDRIKSVIENPNLNSRLKFMLMDVVDLRKKGWKGKESNKGPKTLDEVRADAEAAAAAKAAEAAKATRGGPGGRPPMGHGDARSYSNGPGGHSNSNQIGKDDLKRLRGMGGRSGGHNVTLGPSGMLNSRSNSGRPRLGPTSMLSRNNGDSASSSRTGTPVPSMNSFGVLDMDTPGSPPSAAASPALTKATPDTGDKE